MARQQQTDEGYAWIILAAVFVSAVFAFGGTKAFGVFYVEFLDVYEEGSGATAWIASFSMGLMLACGIIATWLIEMFSVRSVMIAGGLTAAFGHLVSAYVTQMEWLYFTYGVLTGIGRGLCFTPSLMMVNTYFVRRRAMANGMAFAGSGIGSFVLPFVTRLLLNTYGLKGALIVFSALTLNLCVCGALMRPFTTRNTHDEEHPTSNISAAAESHLTSDLESQEIRTTHTSTGIKTANLCDHNKADNERSTGDRKEHLSVRKYAVIDSEKEMQIYPKQADGEVLPNVNENENNLSSSLLVVDNGGAKKRGNDMCNPNIADNYENVRIYSVDGSKDEEISFPFLVRSVDHDNNCSLTNNNDDTSSYTHCVNNNKNVSLNINTNGSFQNHQRFNGGETARKRYGGAWNDQSVDDNEARTGCNFQSVDDNKTHTGCNYHSVDDNEAHTDCNHQSVDDNEAHTGCNYQNVDDNEAQPECSYHSVDDNEAHFDCNNQGVDDNEEHTDCNDQSVDDNEAHNGFNYQIVDDNEAHTDCSYHSVDDNEAHFDCNNQGVDDNEEHTDCNDQSVDDNEAHNGFNFQIVDDNEAHTDCSYHSVDNNEAHTDCNHESVDETETDSDCNDQSVVDNEAHTDCYHQSVVENAAHTDCNHQGVVDNAARTNCNDQSVVDNAARTNYYHQSVVDNETHTYCNHRSVDDNEAHTDCNHHSAVENEAHTDCNHQGVVDNAARTNCNDQSVVDNAARTNYYHHSVVDNEAHTNCNHQSVVDNEAHTDCYHQSVVDNENTSEKVNFTGNNYGLNIQSAKRYNHQRQSVNEIAHTTEERDRLFNPSDCDNPAEPLLQNISDNNQFTQVELCNQYDVVHQPLPIEVNALIKKQNGDFWNRDSKEEFILQHTEFNYRMTDTKVDIEIEHKGVLSGNSHTNLHLSARSKAGERNRKCGLPHIDISILSSPMYLIFETAFLLSTTGYLTHFIMLPAHAVHMGFSKPQADMLLSVIGLADVVGRITVGWFSDLLLISRNKLSAILLAIGGLAAFLIPLTRNYGLLCAYAASVGILPGSASVIVFVLMTESLGARMNPSVFGVHSTLFALPALFGPPIAGWVKDRTGSWSISFILAGSCISIATVIILFITPCVLRKWGAKHQPK